MQKPSRSVAQFIVLLPRVTWVMWGHVGPSKGGGGEGYPHPLWVHVGLRHDHVGSFLLYKRNDTPTRLLHFWERQVQSRPLSLQRVNRKTKMTSDPPVVCRWKNNAPSCKRKTCLMKKGMLSRLRYPTSLPMK